jgi:cytochrome c
MTFRGIESQQARADLVAYLRRAGSEAARGNGSRQVRGLPDLKTVGLAQQVKAIRHCGDTYHVTTAAGKTVPLWEFNLRFKTDSSETGPARGQPAIMPAGMRGDRASVIFADPAEISTFIEKKC